jgi:hypothetical protein
VRSAEDSQVCAGEGFFAETSPERWWSGWHLVELLAVFLLGLVLMSYFYTQPGEAPEDWGIPGNDSFYHIKMAALMPQIGLPDKFPWLRTTIFWKDRFVSHHWGFQALMVPFVLAAKRMGYEYFVGGRWAITLFFGGALAAFHLLLLSERIRFRWMWLGLLLAMPEQFFTRHAMARAIDLSLLCMLLMVFFMFRRRYIAAGLTLAAYIHVYMGGLLYGPVLVGCYFLAGLVSPPGGRVSWKLPLWTGLGWLAGLVTHPYSRGALAFLKVQVLGSGLTPDISVGREWQSYEGVWWFVQMSAVTWIVLAGAIGLRLRFGGPINAKEGSLLLMNVAFLLLVCKARRFIEYWPAFSLLSSVYLVAPVVAVRAPEVTSLPTRWAVAAGIVCAGLIVYAAMVLSRLRIGPLAVEWRAWMLPAAVYFLAPVGRWLIPACRRRLSAGALAVAAGALFVALVAGTLHVALRGQKLPAPLLAVPSWAWVAVGGLYVVAAVLAKRRADAVPPVARISTAAAILACGAGYVVFLLLTVGAQLADLQKSVNCEYDLKATQRAMTFLRENSPAESVVFTDDWDIFPLYFYYNHHNHYIVGLDPKFSHEADPELWERYVKLSRGQFPTTTTVKYTDASGKAAQRSIHVTIDDIVDRFECSYVITDPDHDALARKLENAPSYTERIWPIRGSIDDKPRPPYKIFRIHKPGGDPPEKLPAPTTAT